MRSCPVGSNAVIQFNNTALDAAVLAAYGFSAKKDLFQQFLDLNLDVAARIDRAANPSPPPASRPTSPTQNPSSPTTASARRLDRLAIRRIIGEFTLSSFAHYHG